MVMRWSPLIVAMAALLLVVSVACGGESKPTPSPTATSAPSPTPSSTVTPAPVAVVVRERSRLTPEQEACLAEAIGERAASEVSTGQRPPTSDEPDAFNGCVIAAPVAVEEGKGLTPEQEACLVEAIGERAVREAKTGQRPPTSDEPDAFNGCVIAAPVAVEEGKGLTPEQEACLVEAIGERAVREAKTGQRPPTSDEVDALVGCGIMEPKPDFDLLPEASALAGLGTVAWPNNFQESSALFGRLPSEIAGHRIKARFEQSGLGIFSTTYEEPNKVIMLVTVHDLTKGAFFPTDTNAGQFVALYAQGADWEVLATGREGDLAWVQWKTGGIYTMHWGNAPSSIVFQAMANDLRLLMALVETMVSAASE